MSEEQQRVVVIQYGSRDVITSAIKWAIQGLSLENGDEVTVLAILRQFNSPSFFPFIAAAKLRKLLQTIPHIAFYLFFQMEPEQPVGLFERDQRIVEEEVAKKKKEYCNDAEIHKISELCETEKIQFRIEVIAGSFPEVALTVASNLKATLVILDRKMKKYRECFMEWLSCGILIMRGDNSIRNLRGPIETTVPGRRNANCVRFSRLLSNQKPTEEAFTCSQISSSTTRRRTKALCPLHQSTSSTSHRKKIWCPIRQLKGRENASSEEQDMVIPVPYLQEEVHSKIHHKESPCDQQKQHNESHESHHQVEKFENSVCSVCKNSRPKIGLHRDFTYTELHAATQGFSPKNFLSEGGFGSVHKGELDGLRIAVKQHKCASLQGEKEFKSEVHVLSKARHENVIMLLGSCSEGNHQLHVYEYVCNGSLDQHLSQHSRKPPIWPERIKVAMGAAKGLLYLHENNIIHRDMRPNNILVTHDCGTLLGDFGLAKTEQGDLMYSSDFVGTLGYLAPEYAESGEVSTKRDVYSFGVVLLQLITGMKTKDKRLGEKSLVGWARPLLKEKNYPDLIDERMMDTQDCHQLFWMIRLAEKCLSRNPQKRLSMATVVSALSHILEGSTCSVVLRDCSPAQLDSPDAMFDSPKSEGKIKGPSESEGEDGSYTANDSMNQFERSLRLPPLRITCTNTSVKPPNLSNNEKEQEMEEEETVLFYCI